MVKNSCKYDDKSRMLCVCTDGPTFMFWWVIECDLFDSFHLAVYEQFIQIRCNFPQPARKNEQSLIFRIDFEYTSPHSSAGSSVYCKCWICGCIHWGQTSSIAIDAQSTPKKWKWKQFVVHQIKLIALSNDAIYCRSETLRVCVCECRRSAHVFGESIFNCGHPIKNCSYFIEYWQRDKLCFFSVMPLLLAGDGGAFCIFPVGNIFNIFADTICTRMPDCDTQFCVFFVGGFRRCIVYSNVLTWF